MKFVRGKGNHMKIWWKSVAGMRAVSTGTLRQNKHVMLNGQEGSCGWMWLDGVKKVDFGFKEVEYRC